MKIRSQQEALFIACEMERGAVQLYERALQMMAAAGRKDEPLYDSLKSMLADERSHLCRFESLYAGLDAEVERELILQAVAHGLLFEGGLMAAVRGGLLENVDKMLDCAGAAEEKAKDTYRLFAQQTQEEQVKDMLLAIAQEEGEHLEDIRMRRRVEAPKA